MADDAEGALRAACEAVIRRGAAAAALPIPDDLLDQALPYWIDQMLERGVGLVGNELRVLPTGA